MEKIYKYKLDDPFSEIILPVGSRILNAGIQNDEMFMWAIVNTENGVSEVRRFYYVNTGDEIVYPLYALDYINTATSRNGIVWHIFEIAESN